MRYPGIEPRQLGLKTRKESANNWLSRIKPEGIVSKTALEGAVGLEHKRRVVGQVVKEVVSGGVVAAVARCCDSGEDLVAELVKAGVPPDELQLPNLTNKEIIQLKPYFAEFLVSTVTFRKRSWEGQDKDPVAAFSERVLGISYNPQIICKLKNPFVVKIVQIAMFWKKE